MRDVKELQSPWVTVGCAWLLGFAMFAPLLSIPPIEHIIRKELLWSHAQTSLLFSLPLIILAAIAIPSGLLADRIGMRKAAGTGAILLAAGSLLRAVSVSSGPLFGFTALHGVGLALVYPNLPKVVGAVVSREKVGLVTGIYTTGIVTGGALPLTITLPLVYPITNTIQGALSVWSVPAILAAILWWAIVKEPPGSGVPITNLGKGSQSPYWVLSNRNLWLVALMFFISNFQFYAWAGWTPALMMLKGAPPDLAALIASVRGWAGLPVIFLMPWASYKIGLRKPFLWGAAILMVLLSWWAIYVTVTWSWLLMVILGIASSGTFPMMLALPVELVPKRSIGAASGMVLSIGYVGGLVGPWLAGYLLDITTTLNLTLVILIVIYAMWALIAFVIPETGPKAKLSSMPPSISG